MSGRGRGRGRGRGAPLSQSKLLLKRSAQEAGLDEQNAVLALTRPRLYTDFYWHSSGRCLTETEASEVAQAEASQLPLQSTKRTAMTKNLVMKQRFFMERFAATQHVRVNPAVDVLRYSTREQQAQQSKKPDLVVLEKMGPTLARDERFVPAELARSSKASSSTTTAAKSGTDETTTNEDGTTNIVADDLEKTAGTATAADPNKEGSDDEDENDEDLVDPEDPGEEEGDDYMQDYYAYVVFANHNWSAKGMIYCSNSHRKLWFCSPSCSENRQIGQ